jgi:hypothetical protein
VWHLITDFSEKRMVSVIGVKRIRQLGTALAITSCSLLPDFVNFDDGGDSYPETSVLTRTTRHHIPEDEYST